MDIKSRSKKPYRVPQLVEYGSVVALTGACDGPCVDAAGGMNAID